MVACLECLVWVVWVVHLDQPEVLVQESKVVVVHQVQSVVEALTQPHQVEVQLLQVIVVDHQQAMVHSQIAAKQLDHFDLLATPVMDRHSKEVAIHHQYSEQQHVPSHRRVTPRLQLLQNRLLASHLLLVVEQYQAQLQVLHQLLVQLGQHHLPVPHQPLAYHPQFQVALQDQHSLVETVYQLQPSHQHQPL